MQRKVFALMGLCALILLGCKTEAPSPIEAAVTAAPTVTPAPTSTPSPIPEQAAVIVAQTPTPTVTPQPTPEPTPTPSPEPTATPAPTATPDPFEGQKRVNHRKDDRFFYVTLSDAVKERITGMSYPAPEEPCRVSYDDLRYVRILYVDFDGQEQEGELMVNRRVADDVIDIFYKLYLKQYPLASVKLVDDFGQPGDDGNSMRANNTSAFCYRQVRPSTSTLSRTLT